MRKTIKNVLLILWVLISLKILYLTGNFVFSFLTSLILKFLQISPYFAYNYIWPYLPFSAFPYENLGPEFNKQTILPFVRWLTDVLLFTFILNGWLFLLLKKFNSINLKNKINIYISMILLFLFVWFLQDIFEIFIFKEFIPELKDTFFLKFLHCFFLVYFLLNIITVFTIFGIEKWLLIKRIFLALIFLFLNGIVLQTVYISLLWNEGGLAVMLTHPDIINNSHFYGPKNLNEILPQLYQSYGLNISWCNPTQYEIPCEAIRQKIETVCPLPDTINKLPLGGRTIKSQAIGQIFQLGVNKASSCVELRQLLDTCMEEHMRAEFARRWVESHPQITPKLHMDPIDTWSKYMKK